MNQIDVGDPAASSLSSCLCAFPGGFSLLTETGLLRPFLVPSANQEGSAAPEAAVVTAARPVCLSKPSPEGSFPLGVDIPVDHAWSQDGRVLVALRRSGFAAYAREFDTSVLASRRRRSADEPAEDSSRAETSSRPRPGGAAPSLGLVEACVGSNGFDGKVVACCVLGASATAVASSSGSGSGSGHTYLIAVGGASGVECHALELRRREELGSEEREHTTRRGDTAEDEGKPSGAAPGPTCRPVAHVFQGYPVVALAFSPDSGLLAAAAMTGHVKVWDIAALAPPAPLPQQSSSRQSNSSTAPTKKAAARGRRRGSKKVSLGEALRALQPGPGRTECSDLPALWGSALLMARATSLSFSPDDNATFALACWDGKVALFLPTAAVEADASSPNSEAQKDNAQRNVGGGGSSRAWKQLWREAAAAASPSKKGGENLEDQDGAFLCWCTGPAGPGAPTAGLAISAYGVATGDSPRQRQRREEGHRGAALSGGGALPTPITGQHSPGVGAMPAPITGGQSSHAALPPAVAAAAAGPGFEIFAGNGLGGRVGGAVSGSRPAGLTPERTAERYLIHGLAAGPCFVALYDSDLCLHVVSLAAILEAGRVLPPPPPPPLPAAVSGALSAVAETGSSPAGAVGEEASASLLVNRVTLASNDHGLVAACVRRHRGSDGDGVGDVAQSDDGLELLITWRDATSGLETPDNGECAGGYGGRLPFLPGELADDDGGQGGGNGGVFGADVKWGCVALFTRYCVLVYSRPGKGKATGNTQGAKDGKAIAAKPAGGWSAYAEAPIVHGLLVGGGSTASPLSQRLPEAPADLAHTYLLTVLETGGDDAGGKGPVLSIRSLCDRSVSSRCYLASADDGDNHNREAGVAAGKGGVKVYASPGYGGGVFAVAAEGGRGECAKVWRGTFDEGSSRLELRPSRVITSYPWPEPETLHLQGVAGPNCELFLFKEERDPKSVNGAKADSKGIVRWWMTWPEAEIWRWVDAPALLGDEDLSVSDFVKIFQLEVEETMSSYSCPGADDGPPPPT